MKLHILGILIATALAACAPSGPQIKPDPQQSLKASGAWYQDAVFYHIWVKSFNDSNNDGIGDLNGITAKLDYLNDGNPDTQTDLGVTALWLSPIFACSLKNENMHGYDTTDFYTINPAFGTLEDLKTLLTEAHKRGIRVVFDFAMNLTSRSHPWFFDALKNGPKRDWYVWNPKPDTTWTTLDGKGAWNKVWHKSGDSYYYGVFGPHMPDLNYKNPEVVQAAAQVLTHWLNFGFDGARVDAARHYVEEGPSGASDTPGTHAIFQKFRKEIIDAFGAQGYEKLFLAEVWEKPEIIKPYFGDGTNEFSMAFDFQVPKLLQEFLETGDPEALKTHFQTVQSLYPKAAASGTFLSNHDEVAERPFTAFGENPAKAQLAFALNIFLPGTPFVYYGNEIGLPSGAQTTDTRLRTFMDWTLESSPIRETYKKLIRLRTQHPALTRGTLSFYDPGTPGLLGLQRQSPEETFRVVINPRDKPLKGPKGTLEPYTWQVE